METRLSLGVEHKCVLQTLFIHSIIFFTFLFIPSLSYAIFLSLLLKIIELFLVVEFLFYFLERKNAFFLSFFFKENEIQNLSRFRLL